MKYRVLAKESESITLSYTLVSPPQTTVVRDRRTGRNSDSDFNKTAREGAEESPLVACKLERHGFRYHGANVKPGRPGSSPAAPDKGGFHTLSEHKETSRPSAPQRVEPKTIIVEVKEP